MDALELVYVFAIKLMMKTKKKRVVFDLLSTNMQSQEIAMHLGLAEITVKVRKVKLMQVLEITTLQKLNHIYQCTNCHYLKSFI